MILQDLLPRAANPCPTYHSRSTGRLPAAGDLDRLRLGRLSHANSALPPGRDGGASLPRRRANRGDQLRCLVHGRGDARDHAPVGGPVRRPPHHRGALFRAACYGTCPDFRGRHAFHYEHATGKALSRLAGTYAHGAAVDDGAERTRCTIVRRDQRSGGQRRIHARHSEQGGASRSLRCAAFPVWGCGSWRRRRRCVARRQHGSGIAAPRRWHLYRISTNYIWLRPPPSRSH